MKNLLDKRTLLYAFGIFVVGLCVLAWISPDLAGQVLDILSQWVSSPGT